MVSPATAAILILSPNGFDTKYLFPGSMPHAVTTSSVTNNGAHAGFGYRLVHDGQLAAPGPGAAFTLDLYGPSFGTTDAGDDVYGRPNEWFVTDDTDPTHLGLAGIYFTTAQSTATPYLSSMSMLTPDALATTLNSQYIGFEFDFIGNTGNDTLRGTEWGDKLSGGDGKDLMLGGGGNDTMTGGDGNDHLDAGSGAHDVADYSDKAGKVTLALSNGAGTAKIGSERDKLTGFEGINGGAKGDTLSGDKHANALDGKDGADTMSGGAGNDTLYAASGADRLTGGADKDVFWFTHPYDNAVLGHTQWVETITDFSHAKDSIFLDTINIDGVVTPYASFNFHARAHGHAGDADDYLIYDKSTGKLYYDADAGGGTYAPVVFARLGTGSSHPNVDYTDFFAI